MHCGTQFPAGAGFNFCRLCGAPKPADTPRAAAAVPKGAGGMGSGGAHSGASGSGGNPGEASPYNAPREPEQHSTKASTTTRRLRESKLVKQREVQHYKLPLLAGDAAEQRGWINAYLAYMRRFDATTEDFLFKWSNKSFKLGIKEKDLEDHECCPHLDSLIASDILDRRHYSNRPEMSDLFLELQAYSEERQRLEKPPCGRWMLHLYHRRFYFDRARGTMLTEQHIYQLDLEGFTHAHIQSFYQRVNYARQALPIEAQPDDFKLGHWLFLKIKKARIFEHEVREYKRSTLNYVGLATCGRAFANGSPSNKRTLTPPRLPVPWPVVRSCLLRRRVPKTAGLGVQQRESLTPRLPQSRAGKPRLLQPRLPRPPPPILQQPGLQCSRRSRSFRSRPQRARQKPNLKAQIPAR